MHFPAFPGKLKKIKLTNIRVDFENQEDFQIIWIAKQVEFQIK